MQLRTYTGLWNVEKRIYRFYDVNLPFPITVRQIAVFLGFGVPWVVLLSLIGIPFSPPLPYLLYLAPPILLTWWSNRPVAEGKGLVDFGRSQLMFFLSPKTFAALRPIPPEAEATVLRGSAWRAPSGSA